MLDYVSIVETNKVIHTAKTNMMKLVVEIECFDEFDKETGSSDGLQPKQADLSCIHALNKPHLHEIHVVPSKHEADLYNSKYFFGLVTPFSLIEGQMSGPFSTDSRIILPSPERIALLVPSCFVIFDFEPLSLSFDFVISSKIFKSLSFNLDRLCHLAIFCLDQHAHTLHYLESLLTISLVRLDILKEDLVYQSLQKSLSLCLSILDSGILMLSMSL
nr:hypothetical protein [Tanacetum cinerariifolium]